MKIVLFVALGGAGGATCRYLVALWLTASDSRFPVSTMAVNIGGSFLAGLLVTLLLQRGLAPSSLYAFLVVGFLGSFTTMSTFSMDTIRLLESGQLVSAAVNVIVTILVCLIAAFSGVYGARLLSTGFGA